MLVRIDGKVTGCAQSIVQLTVPLLGVHFKGPQGGHVVVVGVVVVVVIVVVVVVGVVVVVVHEESLTYPRLVSQRLLAFRRLQLAGMKLHEVPFRMLHI